MENTLTTQNWLDYLESKPEEQWIIGAFSATCNGIECHCAAGFITFKPDTSLYDVSTIYKRSNKFLPIFNEDRLELNTIININDGRHLNYQQATPKQRIIALLTDMVAARY